MYIIIRLAKNTIAVIIFTITNENSVVIIKNNNYYYLAWFNINK